MRGKSAIHVLLAAGLLLAPTAWALSKSEAAIAERIRPAGQVCVEGDASCAQAATTTASAGPRTAEDIYGKVCLGCHDTGAAGAPRRGDAAAWNARLESKGLDALVANAINGVAAMPPKGLCMDCSDDEIRLVVEYILENSK